MSRDQAHSVNPVRDNGPTQVGPISNGVKLEKLRHSLAHLLAAAVLKLWPDTKNTIGPAIENGFYYDFDFSSPISDKDLPRIEKEMRQILKTWEGFEEKEVTEKEAKDFFKDNPYKQELIDEIIQKEEKIMFYKSGDFTDLCRGGHVSSMKEIDSEAFKLSHTAGAYWHGSEKNKMLTRIYGLAFETKEGLEEYEQQQAEAKKRDHRKIGAEQELFFIDEMVGKGLVMWLPKGEIIKREIEQLAIQMEDDAGYIRVTTPHLAKEELFKTSGHLPYYKESMYPPMEMDDGTYYLRAMNCPFHNRIYSSKPRSYRELPLRIAEYGTVYRNELSGTLAGLLRVRGLSMNDAHIYCTKAEIKNEFKSVLEMTLKYFEIFGLKDYWFRLSLWDPNHKDKYIDEPENWEYSQNVLREALVEMNVSFIEAEDEAAFYGPKVDAQFKSVIGREESLSTIQLDFSAKKRFELSYTDKDGKINNEVFVIHRAPLSTHERLIAFLIEHYAGAWPVWLSPVQVSVLPISTDKHGEYAEGIYNTLKKNGFRVALRLEGDSLNKKIKMERLQKTPYLIVVGDKEVQSKTVTVEGRGDERHPNITIEEFVTLLKEKVETKSL